VLDPWVTGSPPAAQRALYDAFIDTVAAINRVEWRADGLADVVRGGSASPAGPAGSLAAELDWWTRYLEWSLDGVPLPGLVEALDWCRANAPVAHPAPSLLWGDARLGNLVVGEDRAVVGVLDWEMASVGPAELDLGWLLALEWSMDQLIGRRVPGFPDRAETIGRYEERLGRAVGDLAWHEVFALVRSVAISNRQARMAAAVGARYAMGPDERHPLVGLLRRRIDEAGG
jgi:aminoglycoside phosphotransferase (APT) family kinase protein